MIPTPVPGFAPLSGGFRSPVKKRRLVVNMCKQLHALYSKVVRRLKLTVKFVLCIQLQINPTSLKQVLYKTVWLASHCPLAERVSTVR